jgi:hypothetical protein
VELYDSILAPSAPGLFLMSLILFEVVCHSGLGGSHFCLDYYVSPFLPTQMAGSIGLAVTFDMLL